MFVPLLLVFYAARVLVVQARLDISLDDAECIYSNPKYIKPGSCRVEAEDDSEYGSCLSTYLEITTPIPGSLIGTGSMMGYSMGEYSQDIGLHMQGDVCQVLSDGNSVLGPILDALSITEANCPPKPGVYQRDCYFPDLDSGLPESFPRGMYRLNLSAGFDDETILSGLVYITVQ